MPPVIKNLMIINGLFFLAQAVAGATMPQNSVLAEFLNLLALYPPGSGETGYTIFNRVGEIAGFWPWQLITYAFLHGGLGHLFFNMFALWMFGVQIENRWGAQRFAVFYFVCVVGAAITHLFFVTSPVPTIGASGGVFGILLAFGMMFPNQPIYLYFLFPIKAKWLVIGWGLLELWSGVTGTQAGVANFAHLGGMVVGFLMIQYWRGKIPMLAPNQKMRW